jgi:hypothetical protein
MAELGGQGGLDVAKRSGGLLFGSCLDCAGATTGRLPLLMRALGTYQGASSIRFLRSLRKALVDIVLAGSLVYYIDKL